MPRRGRNLGDSKRFDENGTVNNNNNITLLDENGLGCVGDFHTFFTNNIYGKCAQSRVLRCLSPSETNKKKSKMAVECDHMYLECADSKASIGRDIDIQRLREIILVQLDLIQQQTQELDEKDRTIKTLKEDNQNLKARLERSERRIALSQQKRPVELVPLSVQTDFSLPPVIKSEEKSPPLASPATSPCHRISEQDLVDAVLKSPLQKEAGRKFSPRSNCASKLSPHDRKLRKDGVNSVTEPDSVSSVEFSVSNENESQKSSDTSKKLRTTPLKRAGNDSDATIKKLKPVVLEEPVVQEETVTDHSLRSREKGRSLEEGVKNKDIVPLKREPLRSTSPVHSSSSLHMSQASHTASNSSYFVARFKGRTQKESRSVVGDGFLFTRGSYYLPQVGNPPDLTISSEGEGTLQTQVETPQWRVKVLTSLYVMEGTENLEDEVFGKRHSKPEQEEKRRKRWDLQQMREQRKIEKLRERIEGRNSGNESEILSRGSLWPRKESAHFVLVDEYLPVCAFGQPLTTIHESEFSLPWLADRLPNGILMRRRKR